MVSVIDQIKNRLEILYRQAPLVPIMKEYAQPPTREEIRQPVQQEETGKITFPERALSLSIGDIEPKQITMVDVDEINDSFKPEKPQIANKKTTGVFGKQQRK
jgi:hypothetical protein